MLPLGMARSIIAKPLLSTPRPNLQDEIAIRNGVVNVVSCFSANGYENVILEIANEYGHSRFDHEILKTDSGVASLIRLAQHQLRNSWSSQPDRWRHSRPRSGQRF
jgi:hypothetical protein